MDEDQIDMARVLLNTLIQDYNESLTRIQDGLKMLREVLEGKEELSEGHYEDVHQDSYTANKR